MNEDIPVFSEVEVVKREVEDDKNNDENSEAVDTMEVSEANEENRSLSKEEELKKREDWAYKVLDWLKVAARAKRWDVIEKYADDVITAFLVLVKEEHRGIVLETIREVVNSAKGGD